MVVAPELCVSSMPTGVAVPALPFKRKHHFSCLPVIDFNVVEKYVKELEVRGAFPLCFCICYWVLLVVWHLCWNCNILFRGFTQNLGCSFMTSMEATVLLLLGNHMLLFVTLSRLVQTEITCVCGHTLPQLCAQTSHVQCRTPVDSAESKEVSANYY